MASKTSRKLLFYSKMKGVVETIGGCDVWSFIPQTWTGAIYTYSEDVCAPCMCVLHVGLACRPRMCALPGLLVHVQWFPNGSCVIAHFSVVGVGVYLHECFANGFVRRSPPPSAYSCCVSDQDWDMLPATSRVLRAESCVLVKPSYHSGGTSLNCGIAVADRTFSDGGCIPLLDCQTWQSPAMYGWRLCP